MCFCLLCRCYLLILHRLCFLTWVGEGREGCPDKLATNLSFRLLHLFDFPLETGVMCAVVMTGLGTAVIIFAGGSSAWESCLAMLSLAHLPTGFPSWGSICAGRCGNSLSCAQSSWALMPLVISPSTPLLFLPHIWADVAFEREEWGGNVVQDQSHGPAAVWVLKNETEKMLLGHLASFTEGAVECWP